MSTNNDKPAAPPVAEGPAVADVEDLIAELKEWTQRHPEDTGLVSQSKRLIRHIEAAVAEGPAATPLRERKLGEAGRHLRSVTTPVDLSEAAADVDTDPDAGACCCSVSASPNCPQHGQYAARQFPSMPAAAEPFTTNAVEARATAYDWEKAINCLLLEVEPSIARDVKAAGDRVMADLRGQLDEARRRYDLRSELLYKTLDESGLKTIELMSAEATNQEHRGALAELYVAIKEDSPERLRMALSVAAALLGPQHGDTK